MPSIRGFSHHRRREQTAPRGGGPRQTNQPPLRFDPIKPGPVSQRGQEQIPSRTLSSGPGIRRCPRRQTYGAKQPFDRRPNEGENCDEPDVPYGGMETRWPVPDEESLPYSLNPNVLLDRLKETQCSLQEAVAVIEVWQRERLRMYGPCSPMQDVKPIVHTDYPMPAPDTPAELLMKYAGFDYVPSFGGGRWICRDPQIFERIKQLAQRRDGQYAADQHLFQTRALSVIDEKDPTRPRQPHGAWPAPPRTEANNPFSAQYNGFASGNPDEVHSITPECRTYSPDLAIPHQQAAYQPEPDSLNLDPMNAVRPSVSPHSYGTGSSFHPGRSPGQYTPPPQSRRFATQLPTPDVSPPDRSHQVRCDNDDDSITHKDDHDPPQQWNPSLGQEM